eukprot:4570431-Lingulodinium_polyedra.AAC.1
MEDDLLSVMGGGPKRANAEREDSDMEERESSISASSKRRRFGAEGDGGEDRAYASKAGFGCPGVLLANIAERMSAKIQK